MITEASTRNFGEFIWNFDERYVGALSSISTIDELRSLEDATRNQHYL